MGMVALRSVFMISGGNGGFCVRSGCCRWQDEFSRHFLCLVYAVLVKVLL